MDQQEFAATVAADPNLSGPIERAAQAAGPEQYSLVAGAAVVLMFPIARYVLVEIGLPWLYELRRYSDLWRQKFHTWVDEQAVKQGLDPDAVEAAGDALRAELEKTTDRSARRSWERLATLLKSGPGEENG
jgi:hypothetical protein